MNDRKKDISLGCAVNVAIISQLSSTDVFRQKCIDVPPMLGVKPPVQGDAWPFFNLSWGAYLMYCLLVVPKELYDLPKDDDFYVGFQNVNVMKDFTIKKERKSFSDDPRYHFNSIRNAVSHLNYKISTDDILTLWDHPPGKKDKKDWHWEVGIKHKDMLEFLSKIAEATIKLNNEIRSGIRQSNGKKV